MNARKEWIFVKQYPDKPGRQFMLCSRCGYEEEIRLPIIVSQFCAIMEGFEKSHRRCRPRRKEGTDGNPEAKAAPV